MKKIVTTAALAAGLVAIGIGTSGSANALHRTRVAVAPHYWYAHTWRVFISEKANCRKVSPDYGSAFVFEGEIPLTQWPGLRL